MARGLEQAVEFHVHSALTDRRDRLERTDQLLSLIVRRVSMKLISHQCLESFFGHGVAQCSHKCAPLFRKLNVLQASAVHTRKV